MTNADRIRGMTTNEMWEEIFSGSYLCPELTDDCDKGHDCRKCWIEWLNRETEEDC